MPTFSYLCGKVRRVMMQNRFNFRAALKTENFAIIVPVESVETHFYTMRLKSIKDIFEKKYPENSFDDFVNELNKQNYLNDIFKDAVWVFTKDFTNLMQSTGVYDSTKFKDLSPVLQQEWLQEHKAEDWPGIEIFEGDVTEIKYGKDHYSYGVVSYLTCAAGYDRGGTSLGSYQKKTKVVGNIFEGYPDAAKYDVDFLLSES